MPSLYQLNEELANFEWEFDELTGEVLNMQAYEDLVASLDNKHESYALYIKDRLAFLNALEDEKKSLDERIKKTKKTIESLKNGLSDSLQGNSFETPKCKVSFRKSKSVVIDDEDSFINLYNANRNLVNTKISYSINKKEVKKLLDEEFEIEHAHFEEKKNIQIK